ncbi:growth hormone-inducible transmembrane protein-like [Rhodnius prolixus]|uniref:growth hormone-inducible transmembrane protein-like n=1 Tax=Rhodnius prolixus TaxID=13249 RepID=UPI003D188B85
MDRTGAVFWYCGKLATTTLILLFVGAIIFWTLYEKKGALYEMSEWSQDTKYLIIITYLYLVSSYILTVLSVAYVFGAPMLLDLMAHSPKNVIAVSLIIMTLITALLDYIPYNHKESLLKNGLWTLHSVIMGPAFSYFGAHICIESVNKLFPALVIATMVSFTAPKDTYIEIKPYIKTLYSAVTITSLLCFLFNPPVNIIGITLLTCNLFGGMILYFGVFVTNTQYMLAQVTQHNYDPVYTAAVMYLSTLNLFLRVAMYHVVELTEITHKDECFQHQNEKTCSRI